MVVNPFEVSRTCRYPDETIVPTAVATFNSAISYTVPAAGNVISALNVNLSNVNASNFPTQQPILSPVSFAAGAYTGAYTTYGTAQTTFQGLASSDRTVAAGLRVKVLGLPASTFVASGTFYFVQLDGSGPDADTVLINSTTGETNCINAVLAGKGFSVPAQELLGEGLHIPYFARGANSFIFKDCTLPDSGAVFGSANSSFTVPVGLAGMIQPDPRLTIVGYGLQTGAILRFEYTTHVEYVPLPGSAGLTNNMVEHPDIMKRQIIHSSIANASTSIVKRTTKREIAPVITIHDHLGTGSIVKRLENYARGISSAMDFYTSNRGMMNGIGGLLKGLF